MSLKKGDLIELEYEGRIKRTGKIFDTTNEEVAKKEGIKGEIKSQSIIIGSQMIIEGLETEILKHEVGQSFQKNLTPNHAFGTRKIELVKIFNNNFFKTQKITPYPGLILDIDGMKAKVLSANGGRVRLDFNHPLAGKEVSYDVKILKKLIKKEDYINSIIIQRLGLIPKIEITEKQAKIELSTQLPKEAEDVLKKEIKEHTKLETVFKKTK